MSRANTQKRQQSQQQEPQRRSNDSENDEEADRVTAAAAEARRALADILSRPQQSLADVLGETVHDEDDDAARANDTSREAGDEDPEDIAARRRALLAATMGTAESAGINSHTFDEHAGGRGGDGGDRASLYSELHSYLDGLRARDDLDMPADFDSDLVAEQSAVRAAYGSEGATAAAPSASPTAARPRYQFATPFSPPSNRVIQDNHTPSPSHARGAGAGGTNGVLESKELEPHAARSGSSASKPRATNAISPLSPSNPKGRSSPATSQQNRPSSQSRTAAAPRSPPESKQDGAAGGDAGFDPLNPDIGLEPGEEPFDPQAPFDETKEMDKIAQLDALLAEAEGRSAEMDRRLAELMSQPLPALTDEAGNAVSSGLMLMPPSPSHVQAHDAQQPDDNGFFMTSVPGGVGGAAAASESADAEAQNNNLAAAAPGAVTPADDPALWVFEEVEPMDAPLVLSNGEGFRPSQEDQAKLDEIDALLNHFRASDSALSSNYRPRFVHPPVRARRKKKRAPKPVDPTTTVVVVAQQPLDEDEEEEEIDEPIMSPSDPAVAARVAAFTSALTVHPSASTAAADGELSSSAFEVSEEDKAEIKQLNKKLNRLAKNAAAASSAPAGTAGRTSDDALRHILAKTQASASARSNGGNAASASKFPTFAFPKVGASGYTSVNSTDAILQSLLDDEDRSAAPSLSSAADMEREIHSAMDDENELDDEDGGGRNGDDDNAAAVADDDVPRDPRERMDKLQAQVDAIRARVHTEADDYVLPASTDDAVAEPAPRTGGKKMSTGAGSVSSAAAKSRVSSAGVRRVNYSAAHSSQHTPLTARPRSDPAGPGFDLHGVSAAAALRSDSPPSPSAASSAVGGGAAFSSRSVSSLSDRLDEAIGLRSRPSSSVGSVTTGDAWRSWKPSSGSSAASTGSPASSSFASAPSGASLDGADFGGSASQVRAAARNALPDSSPRGAAYGSPSPRHVVAAGRQARPLRAMSGSGSGTAMLASMQGATPPTAMHAQRAGRPMSANHADSSVTSLPPPISSTQAQLQASASRTKLSKTQQLPTVDAHATWK